MTISKIEIKKKEVIIFLSNNKTLNITLETYLNNTILLDEEITDEEIECIKKDDLIQIAKRELITKLYRKKLSKKECELFLKDRELDGKSCDQLLSDMEKNYLINDSELMINIIDYCLVNRKGIDNIIAKLKERKIRFSEREIKENISEEKYVNNIKYLIQKYQKMSKNKPERQLKKYIENKLIDNGYRVDEFYEYLIIEKPDELSIATKEINKFFTCKERNKENISKITKKLLSKGFNYDIIKKALGSDNYETY